MKCVRNPLLALAMATSMTSPAAAADLISFWDKPQKGANSFNGAPPDQAYFDALAATGATWVRLTFSKWQGEGRDFLVGDADRYVGLKGVDLATLRRTLDAAQAAGLKVVVVPLVLPGARWIQQNQGKLDSRLWTDPDFADQAVQFWADLADELKDHPAVAAYNLVNEPAPEKSTSLSETASLRGLKDWQKEQAGGTRDLLRLYERIIAAIRMVDKLTPIMVDSGFHADARSLAAWPRALDDDKVLYAFHMYEPYQATSSPNMRHETPLRYPGTRTEYADGVWTWDRKSVAAHIDLAFDWAKQHGIDPNRMVVGEFGCMRRWVDCGEYLADVIDAIDAREGHWAFYAFREDVWDGMDYELPASVKPGRFYYLIEQGRADELPRDGALMQLLKAKMRH